MAITLSNIGTAKKKKTRVGRGNGSGHGTYCGRGKKGQKARSGGKGGLKLKGFRRTLLTMPKFKGMKPRYPKKQVVLLSTIEKLFSVGEVVSPQTLFDKRVIDKKSLPVKVLLAKKQESLTKKLELTGVIVSQKAKEVIEKAGGKVT